MDNPGHYHAKIDVMFIMGPAGPMLCSSQASGSPF